MSYVKDPEETLDFLLDWSDWLGGTDEIDTSTWTVPAGVTQTNDTETATTATIWVSGGTAGESYKLTNTIQTVAGRTGEREIWLAVRELLLSVGDYDAVRAALDVSFDANVIPNAIVSMDIYAGAAERELRRRVDVDALDAGDLAAARTALIYLTAARLAPAVPNVLSEDQENYSYRRQGMDWGRRAQELRSQADAELDAIEGEARTVGRPTMFTTAPGGRGKLRS